MKRKVIALFVRLTILVSVMLTCAQITVPVRAQPSVFGGWMTQPVTLDGQITTAKEWSEAVPVDLALRNTPGVTIPVRIWIKNDLKWIFILAAVKWPANDIDRRDYFKIIILSGPNRPGTIADEFRVSFGGDTADSYRVLREGGADDLNEDIRMSPPGENNVRGGASYNGTHYWFEFGKPLNTGDRYDLVLMPGQTYTNVRFLVVDGSVLADAERIYQITSAMTLAPVLPSINSASPVHQMIMSISQVDFSASVSGHLSKVTLLVEREYEMKFNEKTGLYEASLTLADGIYKWRVNALGVLGNVTSIPERSLTVDATRPAVTIRSPTAGEIVRKSEVLVSWEALDATSGIAKVEVKVDTSDWIDVTGKTSYTATWIVEGNHEVRVRATDRAGNVAEQVITFTTSPPPWYATYWYVPLGAVAAVVAIAAAMKSRGRPPKPAKPPEVKPLKMEPPPKPPTREELLKELEELYRSGRIAETAYRRLKKKYETKTE